jgi:hypothetical protein
MRPIRYLETSVSNYQSTLRHTPQASSQPQHLFPSTETSVTVYQSTLRHISQELNMDLLLLFEEPT